MWVFHVVAVPEVQKWSLSFSIVSEVRVYWPPTRFLTLQLRVQSDQSYMRIHGNRPLFLETILDDLGCFLYTKSGAPKIPLISSRAASPRK